MRVVSKLFTNCLVAVLVNTAKLWGVASRYWRYIALSSLICIGLPLTAQTSTTTTTATGSYLGVVGQVVPPSSPDTVNSTDAIASNDTVKWINYFSSKLPSPFKSDGVMTLPANFSWVAGSIIAPSNVTLRFKVGGIWQNNEPATGTVVTHVGWIINPLYTIKIQPSAPPALNFQGTGDGYRVITYKDRIYVVNHHAAGTSLNCRSAVTSLPCPGFEIEGKVIPLTFGSDIAPKVVWYQTPERSIEHMDIATGNLYIYVSYNTEIIVLCGNLDTLKACANYTSMINTDYQSPGMVNPIGSIGSKYYAQARSGQILCYDTSTKAACAGQPYNINRWGGTASAMATILDNKIFINGLINSEANQLQCFDTVTNGICDGWNNTPHPLYNSFQAFPVLDSAGAPKGVCTWLGCRLINGLSFTPTAEYWDFLNNNQFKDPYANYSYADPNVYGTRVFHAPNNYVRFYASCFDFATNATCPNFPLPSPSTGLTPATYSVNKDLVRANCMWALGDSALAKSFDPRTGGDCPAGSVVPPTILLNVEPITNYQCDGSRASISKWGKVRFSPALTWGGNGLTSVKVKLMNSVGVVLPAALSPNRSFANNTFELDISDIPYAAYPKLKVELTLEAGDRAIDAEVGFDVTWDGDPAQLCFKTKAPVLDNCQVGVSVVQDNAAVHIPNVVETLNASTGLTPGNPANGSGPAVASSTLRQYPSGSSDPTQILQTRFAMGNLTGDLWQYPLNADYTLALTPSSKASATTSARTLYTSTPNATGGWNRIPLDYTQLNASQQAAVNVNLQGASDTLGAQRVAYLAGSTANEVRNGGTLRNRSTLLGTAIDSAPTLLHTVPLAGYSERSYPHYTAFRQTQSRPDKLAFYAANDGLLHAYKVKTAGLTQAFSYMPGVVLKSATRYTDTSLSQARLSPYWMDNTPMVADVNLGATVTDNQWRSVVVGNQGRGGRGVYALDVTSGGLDKILFEYDNTTDPDLKDLGYVMGQPPSDRVTGADQVVRMNNGRWAYVMGNGINSNVGGAAGGTGRAVLYIFYLNGSNGGAKWQKISVNTTGTFNPALDTLNGLSNPRPVDVDGDGKVDLIYAGDIKGNLWRFDVRDLNNVTVTKLFTTATGQAIHSAPMASRVAQTGACPNNGVRGCWMVTVGTGEALNPLSTSNSTVTQSIYGIFDKGDTGSAALVTAAQLVAQTLVVNAPNAAGVVTRSVSSNPVAYSATVRGWKINLTPAEHVSSNPVLQSNGAIAFGSTRPSGASAASCALRDSWITMVNPINGYGAVGILDGNGAGIAIGGSTFSLPQTLLKPGLSNSQGTLMFSDLRSATAADTSGGTKITSPSMVGRLSWREVFGAPK
jgi:Neisseria PilC beta-propeller domain